FALSDDSRRPAGRDGHVPPGMGAAAGKQDDGVRSFRRRHETPEDVPDPVRAGEGPGTLRRNVALSTAAHAGRPAPPGRDSGIHPFRTEGRFSDRRRAVPSFPGYRPRSGVGHAFDRDGATAARNDLRAVQNSALRSGGRLEPGARLVDEGILRMTPETVIQ